MSKPLISQRTKANQKRKRKNQNNRSSKNPIRTDVNTNVQNKNVKVKNVQKKRPVFLNHPSYQRPSKSSISSKSTISVPLPNLNSIVNGVQAVFSQIGNATLSLKRLWLKNHRPTSEASQNRLKQKNLLNEGKIELSKEEFDGLIKRVSMLEKNLDSFLKLQKKASITAMTTKKDSVETDDKKRVDNVLNVQNTMEKGSEKGMINAEIVSKVEKNNKKIKFDFETADEKNESLEFLKNFRTQNKKEKTSEKDNSFAQGTVSTSKNDSDSRIHEPSKQYQPQASLSPKRGLKTNIQPKTALGITSSMLRKSKDNLEKSKEKVEKTSNSNLKVTKEMLQDSKRKLQPLKDIEKGNQDIKTRGPIHMPYKSISTDMLAELKARLERTREMTYQSDSDSEWESQSKREPVD
eukprot:TRINITY_DN1959_c0_g1_i1.p1 TRINITY_DN1959_c0_g1~~TRINITY_DN1959_c0_g1_i1.p1  ORF type:complete len:407 (+),score=117.94 TRINITY_DN1959_c0_g1_i1:79-1299(+)